MFFTLYRSHVIRPAIYRRQRNVLVSRLHHRDREVGAM